MLLFPATPPTDIYPLSLHDALPIYATTDPSVGRRPSESSSPRAVGANGTSSRSDRGNAPRASWPEARTGRRTRSHRSEEHTSELQSLRHLVCRLLLEKKNHHDDHTL